MSHRALFRETGVANFARKYGHGTRHCPAERIDGGQHEQFERYHRGNGISRQAENELVAARREYGWAPGTNRNSCEMELRAQIGENLLDQIVLAHGHAAGEDEDILFEPALDGRPQCVFVVRHISKLDSGCAPAGARENFR